MCHRFPASPRLCPGWPAKAHIINRDPSWMPHRVGVGIALPGSHITTKVVSPRLPGNGQPSLKPVSLAVVFSHPPLDRQGRHDRLRPRLARERATVGEALRCKRRRSVPFFCGELTSFAKNFVHQPPASCEGAGAFSFNLGPCHIF